MKILVYHVLNHRVCYDDNYARSKDIVNVNFDVAQKLDQRAMKNIEIYHVCGIFLLTTTLQYHVNFLNSMDYLKSCIFTRSLQAVQDRHIFKNSVRHL